MSDHGTPIWFDLKTPDLEATQRFYAAVLGWDWLEVPDLHYHLARKEAAMVAGLVQGEGAAAWTVVIGVEDADESAQEVEDAGGAVLEGPYSIPRTGRYARVMDPQGAEFGLLAPLAMQEESAPAWNQSALGHATWIELLTADPKPALGFYNHLFGWQAESNIDLGPRGIYHVFSHDGCAIGGMMGLSGTPDPHWLPYFAVQNLRASRETAESLGAQICAGPREVDSATGPKTILILTDPQGAVFALIGD